MHVPRDRGLVIENQSVARAASDTKRIPFISSPQEEGMPLFPSYSLAFDVFPNSLSLRLLASQVPRPVWKRRNDPSHDFFFSGVNGGEREAISVWMGSDQRTWSSLRKRINRLFEPRKRAAFPRNPVITFPVIFCFQPRFGRGDRKSYRGGPLADRSKYWIHNTLIIERVFSITMLLAHKKHTSLYPITSDKRIYITITTVRVNQLFKDGSP